jgi:hypothetical protein
MLIYPAFLTVYPGANDSMAAVPPLALTIKFIASPTIDNTQLEGLS